MIAILLLVACTAVAQPGQGADHGPCTTEQIEQRVDDTTAKMDALLAAMGQLAAEMDTDTPAEAAPAEEAPSADTDAEAEADTEDTEVGVEVDAAP